MSISMRIQIPNDDDDVITSAINAFHGCDASSATISLEEHNSESHPVWIDDDAISPQEKEKEDDDDEYCCYDGTDAGYISPAR
jgi:hypothetical protein